MENANRQPQSIIDECSGKPVIRIPIVDNSHPENA